MSTLSGIWSGFLKQFDIRKCFNCLVRTVEHDKQPARVDLRSFVDCFPCSWIQPSVCDGEAVSVQPK